MFHLNGKNSDVKKGEKGEHKYVIIEIKGKTANYTTVQMKLIKRH